MVFVLPFLSAEASEEQEVADLPWVVVVNLVRIPRGAPVK